MTRFTLVAATGGLAPDASAVALRVRLPCAGTSAEVQVPRLLPSAASRMVKVAFRDTELALEMRTASVKAVLPGPATPPRIRALPSWGHDDRLVTAVAPAFTSCTSPRNAPPTAAFKDPAACAAVSFGV